MRRGHIRARLLRGTCRRGDNAETETPRRRWIEGAKLNLDSQKSRKGRKAIAILSR